MWRSSYPTNGRHTWGLLPAGTAEWRLTAEDRGEGPGVLALWLSSVKSARLGGLLLSVGAGSMCACVLYAVCALCALWLCGVVAVLLGRAATCALVADANL